MSTTTPKLPAIEESEWREFELWYGQTFPKELPAMADRREQWRTWLWDKPLGRVREALGAWALEHPGQVPTLGNAQLLYDRYRPPRRPPPPKPVLPRCQRCQGTGWAWVIAVRLQGKPWVVSAAGKLLWGKAPEPGERLEVMAYPCANPQCGHGWGRLPEVYGPLDFPERLKAEHYHETTNPHQYASEEDACRVLARLRPPEPQPHVET